MIRDLAPVGHNSPCSEHSRPDLRPVPKGISTSRIARRGDRPSASIAGEHDIGNAQRTTHKRRTEAVRALPNPGACTLCDFHVLLDPDERTDRVRGNRRHHHDRRDRILDSRIHWAFRSGQGPHAALCHLGVARRHLRMYRGCCVRARRSLCRSVQDAARRAPRGMGAVPDDVQPDLLLAGAVVSIEPIDSRCDADSNLSHFHCGPDSLSVVPRLPFPSVGFHALLLWPMWQMLSFSFRSRMPDCAC
jgi:hypothetical protein